jgi:hypothetical protein
VTSGVPGGQRVPQDPTEQMAAILGFRMSRVTSPRQLLLLVLLKLQNVRLFKKKMLAATKRIHFHSDSNPICGSNCFWRHTIRHLRHWDFEKLEIQFGNTSATFPETIIMSGCAYEHLL